MPSFEISKYAQPDFIFNSRRSPVYATRSMVASSQPLATEAGLEILRKGGNAADAAIAVAAALAVIEPCSTGMGGDAFALYYNSASQQVHALNGSGKSAENISLEKVTAMGIKTELPMRHAMTVNVPGAFALWCDLIEQNGSLPLSEIFYPAIRYAMQGFPVSPITAMLWEEGYHEILKNSPNGADLLLNGKPPRCGQLMLNRKLGATLAKLAERDTSGAKKLFYEGEFAEKLVCAVQDNGGFLTLEDMSRHTSLWQQSIKTDYRGYEVHECPPNGQGLAALIALNTLSNLAHQADKNISTQRLHQQIECMRMAFSDVRQHIADTQQYSCPVDGLLSDSYGKSRASLITPHKTNLAIQSGFPVNTSDTVYFCVIDEDGNGCSMVNSNYMGFGTGIVPEGLGFPLQNRGHNFSLDPDHPNVLAGGKRSYHTIIPGICLRADKTLHSVFGVMGGFMQPQGHMQIISAMLDDGLNPQEALNRLRFCIEPGDAGEQICLEEGISTSIAEKLRQMGHPVKICKEYQRTLFGRGQIICRDKESKVLCAGSDPRSDGHAAGLC